MKKLNLVLTMILCSFSIHNAWSLDVGSYKMKSSRHAQKDHYAFVEKIAGSAHSYHLAVFELSHAAKSRQTDYRGDDVWAKGNVYIITEVKKGDYYLKSLSKIFTKDEQWSQFNEDLHHRYFDKDSVFLEENESSGVLFEREQDRFDINFKNDVDFENNSWSFDKDDTYSWVHWKEGHYSSSVSVIGDGDLVIPSLKLHFSFKAKAFQKHLQNALSQFNGDCDFRDIYITQTCQYREVFYKAGKKIYLGFETEEVKERGPYGKKGIIPILFLKKKGRLTKDKYFVVYPREGNIMQLED